EMRLLLLEDTIELGEVIDNQMTDEGHAVDWVQTIGQAKAALASTQYDLILLDLMLPDGHGIDLLKALRHSGDSTAVIILTARSEMRLLLLEDTIELGEVIDNQMTDEGHAVDWVQTIGQAKAALASTQYDLILLDLMLPDGHGIDLLKALRHSGDSTAVIILTA